MVSSLSPVVATPPPLESTPSHLPIPSMSISMSMSSAAVSISNSRSPFSISIRSAPPPPLNLLDPHADREHHVDDGYDDDVVEEAALIENEVHGSDEDEVDESSKASGHGVLICSRHDGRDLDANDEVMVGGDMMEGKHEELSSPNEDGL